MADHRDLKEADGLHEPKGVEAALAGQIYVANGAGSGSWVTDLAQRPNLLETATTEVAEVSVTAALNPVKISSLYVLYATKDVTGDITIDGNGTITVNTPGYYQLNVVGRTSPAANLGGVNETSALQLWYAGAQPAVTEPQTIRYTHMRDSVARDPVAFSYSRTKNMVAGETLEFYHIGLDASSDVWYDSLITSLIKIGA